MVSMRRLPLALALALAAFGAAAPAMAQSGLQRSGDLIVLSGDVTVERDESFGDVVVLSGDVRVDGLVRENVVVIDGRISVAGSVRGDVVALSGRVVLERTARVDGDVWVGEGRPDVAVGAEVRGRIREGSPLRFLAPSSLFAKVAVWLAISLSTLLLGLVALWLAPRGADAVHRAAVTSLGAVIGWGAAAFVGLPVAVVLLAVSLVGIPFALGLLLGLALLYSLGYVWAAWVLGRVLFRPSGPARPRRVLAFLAGWAILRVVGLLPVAGGIVWLLASAFGLGAMVVATWRARHPPRPAEARPAAAGVLPADPAQVRPPADDAPS